MFRYVRSIGLSSLVAILIGGIFAAPSEAISDTTPPVVSDLSVSPPSIDTSGTAETVSVRVRITDDLSGVDSPGAVIAFRSPSGAQSTDVVLRSGHRTSGTALDGVYENDMSVPQYAETGTWTVSAIAATDNTGNYKNWSGAELASAGLDKTFDQTGSGDTDPPTPSQLSVLPATVNTSLSAAVVSVQVRITDDLSGVDSPGAVIAFRSPSGAQSTDVVLRSGHRTSGTALNGMYENDMSVPQYAEAGTWKVSAVVIADDAGNYTNLSGTALTTAGLDQTFQVVETTLVPGSPRNPAANAGPNQATVIWNPPANDGGSPITGYTVTALSGQTAVAALTVSGITATLTGLTNGVEYTFNVMATNAAGTGPGSAATAPVIPRSVPAAPTAVSASPGDGQASVAWPAPSNNGGATIASYIVTTYSGTAAIRTTTVTSPSTSATVTSLTNGTPYTFKVAATNAVGTGAQSVASTPTAPFAPVVAPSIVTGVSATAGDGQATLSWSMPTSNGGSPITGYLIDVRTSGGTIRTQTIYDTTTTAVITGLSNGTTYTFTVAATTTVKVGPSSAASNAVTPAAPQNTDPVIIPAGTRSGYWRVGSDWTVYAFGDAKPFGNAAVGEATAVDLEPSPVGKGYWIVDELGRVFAFGDAISRGNVDRSRLVAGEKVTSISATSGGGGYWVFTDRGRVLTFGDAAFLGDVSKLTLAGPVLDSIVTPSGNGYYMVASDGGIFAFGDATFYGSMGGQHLNAPVQSLVPDADGVGYWLVASDGGIFAFQADFHGSMGATHLNKPVTGMVRSGSGYLMVGEDGGIFDFSGTTDGFKGSLGANPPAHPITSVAVLEDH